jgi:hypothetical protein
MFLQDELKTDNSLRCLDFLKSLFESYKKLNFFEIELEIPSIRY